MKNYITNLIPAEKIIIPLIVAGETKDVEIIGYPYKISVNGKMVDAIKGIIDDEERNVLLAGRPQIKEKIQESERKREEELLKRVEGLEEYLEIIEDNITYQDNLNKMMDDENNDGVYPPKKPALTTEEAKNKYPQAAAYCKMIKYSKANPASRIGYIRRCAADEGISAFLAGASATEALGIIERKIKEEIEKPEYRDAVAGM